jgi:uncharacterized RDD family membrane protein YckC
MGDQEGGERELPTTPGAGFPPSKRSDTVMAPAGGAVLSQETIGRSATMVADSQPMPIGKSIVTRRFDGQSSISQAGETAYAVDLPALGAAEADDPLVGTRIDHFQIRGRLGQGGMGTVYLAHDLSLQRPVALKVLRRELAKVPSLIQRLMVEARAQARLQHPHVVTIYYIGEHDGAPYFAMEYVRGRSLEDHLREHGALPWAEALEYVLQTARALAAAHQRGIIHQDVKPSNLILCPAEHGAGLPEVKVADFGLAGPVGDRSTAFSGSPHYASPEQMAGEEVDHRTDIYALGITLYQLLTGERPYEATTLREMLVRHRSQQRAPLPEDAAPERLRALVAEMMQPDPGQRPADYRTLIARLEAARPRSSAVAAVMSRGMALAVDLTVLAIFGQVLANALPLSQRLGNQLGMLLFGLYYVVAHRRWGRTLGKKLFGLRVQRQRRALGAGTLALRFVVQFWGPILAILMINLQLGAATDLDTVKQRLTGVVGVDHIPIVDESLQALLRTVLVPNLLLAIPWLAGFVVALFDEKRRTLHDRAAGTTVVYGDG